MSKIKLNFQMKFGPTDALLIYQNFAIGNIVKGVEIVHKTNYTALYE
jgi:hypothetical protein